VRAALSLNTASRRMYSGPSSRPPGACLRNGRSSRSEVMPALNRVTGDRSIWERMRSLALRR
jgi:hypothetical protein